MITKQARAIMKADVISAYTHFEVGTGGDSTNPNANTLDAPLGNRATLTSVSSGESSVDFSFTVQGSTFVGHTIKEVGIFSASTSGDMLLRVNYDGIGPLTSLDEIEFIITVEVD